MKINVPGSGLYDLRTLVLDLNGTIALNGKLVPGVKQRIQKIKSLGLDVYIFTGDTRGTGLKTAKILGVNLVKAGTASEKLSALKKIKPINCVTIGNGAIDDKFLKYSRLGIAVLQSEGVHVNALMAADILMPSINDALDILINKTTFISTLRK